MKNPRQERLTGLLLLLFLDSFWRGPDGGNIFLVCLRYVKHLVVQLSGASPFPFLVPPQTPPRQTTGKDKGGLPPSCFRAAAGSQSPPPNPRPTPQTPDSFALAGSSLSLSLCRTRRLIRALATPTSLFCGASLSHSLSFSLFPSFTLSLPLRPCSITSACLGRLIGPYTCFTAFYTLKKTPKK
jgi:hypothetical protein